jgi:hypothetical protein
LYSKPKQENASPPDAGKYIRIGIVVAIGLVIFAIVGNQGIIISMNISEFGEKFTKPLFYGVVSAVVLSAVALIRVNILKRSSIFWYGLNTAITFLNRGTNDPVTRNITSFRDYKLSIPSFVIWQITKVLLFGAFFTNVMFGFATISFIDGNYLGIESLPTLFELPFLTPPTDTSYAFDNVVPMIPALIILIPPILAAIGIRIVLYVGLHSIIRVVTSYIQDSSEGKPRFLNYISTLEGIIGIGVLWAAFSMFFTDQIDYNTRYVIGGTFVAGFALITFSFLDRIRAKILTHPIKRDIYIRVLTIIAIAIIVGAITSVNNSIADARKLEFLGPYTAQQIGVNRYLGELYKVQENTHNVQLQSVSPNNIKNYVKT